MTTNRSSRARTAQETLKILGQGRYDHPETGTVDISSSLENAITNTRLYSPDELLPIEPGSPHRTDGTTYDVRNETTLAAAQRLVGRGDRVLALNFASAKNPGGGFMGGSQAQEESIARASGLYACVESSPMYTINRRCNTCLYTDHMIYSPDVPVFRDDDDRLLEEPYLLSLITAPAVNAGVVRSREAEHEDQIPETMRRRIGMILHIAMKHGYETLVLGAWGCGVFRNRPEEVARWFADVLKGEGVEAFFSHIIFAVLDRTEGKKTLAPFYRTFSTASQPD